MSCAYAWHKQSRAKAAQNSAFQALKKEVASLKEEKERLATHWGRQEEAYKVMEEGPSSPHDESQASKTRRSSL